MASIFASPFYKYVCFIFNMPGPDRVFSNLTRQDSRVRLPFLLSQVPFFLDRLVQLHPVALSEVVPVRQRDATLAALIYPGDLVLAMPELGYGACK